MRWYESARKKRILPVCVVDFFNGWENGVTIVSLLSREYDMRFTENPTVVLCHQFGGEHKKYDCPKIFTAGETWPFLPDDYDLLFTFDYRETEKTFRFPLYGYYYPGTTLCKNFSREMGRNVLSQKTEFCNFVYSNGYPQDRIRFMELLSEYKRVDCCGHVMNNTGFHVEGTHSGPEKIRFLSKYKFTLAFENDSKTGYTTEKICGAMAANSIPVYFGNPEVHRDFNPKSFVNVHDYPSFDKAVERIIELDQNDELYLDVLCEPWFHDNIPTPYTDTNQLLSRLVSWIESRHLSLEPL